MTTDETIQELSARLEKAERDALRLCEAIRETLMENRHLADGDVCTLKKLKDAIHFEFPEDE